MRSGLGLFRDLSKRGLTNKTGTPGGRRALCVSLLTKSPFVLVAAILGLVLVPVAYNAGDDACDRTPAVRDALVAAAGASGCGQVTSQKLLDVVELDLSGSGISSVGAQDFVGLHSLRTLDLSDNSLEELPGGVFDDLPLLETLDLSGNDLESVPADLFDELFVLEELILNGNEFSSLPDGMFDELSRFDGIQSNGDAPDNSGDYPRIQRFLDRDGITSAEEFIDALPPWYKKRFAMTYTSGSPAVDHVSSEHPRVASWGTDGSFIFAWNTDPDAPDKFRKSVEFLRQNDDDWTAGVVDFTGESPAVTAPESCRVCHGTLNKPLWGKWGKWAGSENDFAADEDAAEDPEEDAVERSDEDALEDAVENMQRLMDSTEPRMAALDFSGSRFSSGSLAERFIHAPGHWNDVRVSAEAGAVWSWRHAEVLHTRLKAQKSDYESLAGDLACMDVEDVKYLLFREFDMRDHNLFVPANISAERVGEDGLLLDDDLVRYAYYYQAAGSLPDAVNFLVLFDLWGREPIVRKLYRETSNADTLPPKYQDYSSFYLYYPSGSATAERELIQKYRIHFGRGGAAFLDARAEQNGREWLNGHPSAQFWDAHMVVMRDSVCEALRGSKPRNLAVSPSHGNNVLTWDAPTYQAEDLTGYQILRGVDGAAMTEFVADTGNTVTTWTDQSPAPGEYVYSAKAIYGDYPSPESSRVATSVALSTDATLSALGLTGITLTFYPGTTQYTVNVENSLSETTVTATAKGSGAVHTVKLGGVADEDGTVALAVGENAVTVEVTAEDEVTSRTYTVTVVRSANTPATGQPAISGTAQVGATLSASTSGITDADGLENAAFSYQWITSDGGTDADIAGATGSTYTLSGSEAGKNVKVRVSFTDDAGNSETLTSAAVYTLPPPLTAEFQNVPESHDGEGEITLRVAFNQDITTGWEDVRDHSFVVTSGDVTGASRVDRRSDLWEITVDPEDDDNVIVSMTKGRDCDESGAPCNGDGMRLTNQPEATIPGPNRAATGAPTISGTAQAGETLTADTSGISDADGLENATFAYQWITSDGGTDTDIASAAGSTYTLTDAEAGKNVKVRVSFTDDDGDSETLTSAAVYVPSRQAVLSTDATLSALDLTGITLTFDPGTTQYVVNVENSLSETTVTATANDSGAVHTVKLGGVADEDGTVALAVGENAVTVEVTAEDEVTFRTYTVTVVRSANTPATGQPAISGTAQVGATLSASTSGITDADGLENAAFSYQWITSDGGTDTDIAGATGSTYTLTDAEADKNVKVRVSFTDDAGNSEMLTSAAVYVSPPLTAEFLGVPGSHDGETAITFELRFSVEPSLKFEKVRDDVLTVTNGDVTAVRRTDPESDTPNSRWEITVEPDDDDEVTVALPPTTDCAVDSAVCTTGGTMLSNRSAITVPGPTPTNTAATGQPTITGSTTVRSTLTAGTSGISDANGVENASFAYQWITSDGGTDTAISGATGSTYTVASADEGNAVKVRVSFTDDDGFSESLTSAGLDIPVVPLEGFFDAATVPASHGGVNTTFTFQLYFSVEPTLSFEDVRDDVLAITNGDVTAVRRTHPQSGTPNSRWEITVQPSRDNAVTIALSPTTDCAVDSALCTRYGKRLSNSASISVAGS